MPRWSLSRFAPLQGSLIQELTRGSWATNLHATGTIVANVTKNNRVASSAFRCQQLIIGHLLIYAFSVTTKRAAILKKGAWGERDSTDADRS